MPFLMAETPIIKKGMNGFLSVGKHPSKNDFYPWANIHQKNDFRS